MPLSTGSHIREGEVCCRQNPELGHQQFVHSWPQTVAENMTIGGPREVLSLKYCLNFGKGHHQEVS